MKITNFLLILMLATLTVGCASSVFQNRDSSYIKAKSIAPTKIPPGLVSNHFHQYYPVSDKEYPASAKKVSIVPPGLNS